uniref:Uncharacterized protein n=1 Tax=Ciona savignyi TaxID=51511 RepID=H2ZEI0_CIOSA
MIYFYFVIVGVLLVAGRSIGCPNCFNECEAGYINCISCACA